jgi:hypothetical protein
MFQLNTKAKRLVLALAVVSVGAGLLVGSGALARGSSALVATRYDWQMLPDAPVDLRFGLTSVWTGSELIVSDADSAAAYDPATKVWRKLPTPPEMDNFCRRSAAWTGKEMLVWGCGQAAFDPAASTWRRLPPAPTWHGALVWTGRELVGWGGGCCGDVADDGSAYDPASNSWRKVAPAPISGQQAPAAVWTGHELVVLNGNDPDGKPVGGAAYDPRKDNWRRVPSLPQRTPGALAVWSGSEVLLVGGGLGHAGGYALDPASNRWRELANVELPGLPLLAVWTGLRVIALGPKATAYEPGTDRWSLLPAPPRDLRQGGAAVWTGNKLFVVTPSGVAASLVPAPGKALGLSPPLPQCCGGG